jgi:predicted flap endonuclease-1-like 5' DNA nuclease
MGGILALDMIEDAVTYPMEGDDAPKTLLIGGVIYLASGLIGFFAAILSIIPLVGLILGPLGALVAMVPSLLVGGYSVSVCRSVMEDREEPPAFDDWGRLVRDGLKVAVIGLLYALPVILLGVVALVLFLVVSFIFGSYSDVTSIASLLITSLGSLVAAVYGLAIGYVMPAAIFNYARSEKISSAWDVGTLRTIATDVEYAKAWAVGFLFLAVANVVGSSLTLLLVGFLVFFYGQVAAMYLYANGAMEALDMPRSGPAADEGTGQRDATTDSAGGEASGTGGSDTDGDREGTAGRDRGRRRRSDRPDEGGRRTDADSRDTDRRTGRGRAPDEDDGATGSATDVDEDGGATGSETDVDEDDIGAEPDVDDEGESGDDSGFAIDEEDAGDDEADRNLEDVTGIGPTTGDSLRMAGYDSVADLQDASRSELADIEGIGPAKADRIKDDVDGE